MSDSDPPNSTGPTRGSTVDDDGRILQDAQPAPDAEVTPATDAAPPADTPVPEGDTQPVDAPEDTSSAEVNTSTTSDERSEDSARPSPVKPEPSESSVTSGNAASTDSETKAKTDEDDEEDESEDESILEKPISKDEGGSPAWITTFADLMSLLMCFFVMLLSMSTLEMTTYKEMVQSMKEGFGLSSGDSIENISAEEIIDEAAVLQAAAKLKTKKDAANLREVLRDEVQDGMVEVEEGDQLITIQILQAGSFSAGSADLKPSFNEVAERLRGAIKGITGAISITGHTDDSPISTQRFRSNWELSSARAYSVMHALFKGQEMDETRFVLRGLAETRPRVPNDSPANRAKNRRVEIVIDQRDESLKNINLARGTGDGGEEERIIINAGNIDRFTEDVITPQKVKLESQSKTPDQTD